MFSKLFEQWTDNCTGLGSTNEGLGVAYLSQALMTNTTLTQLILESKNKEIVYTHIWHFQHLNCFSISIKSIESDIGDAGAKSLSDALKSNTTLSELSLGCEHKRNKTQMASINKPLFFHSYQINSKHDWKRRSNIIE